MVGRPPALADEAEAEARAAAQRLLQLSASKPFTLATAESCTGGLVGAMVTEVAGSSGYYLGGVVSYANLAKVALLGVKQATLDRVGAVSEETALEMADGIRRRLGADLGLSLTGIAGPGGGSPDKSVGLVFIGLATRDGVMARRFVFEGDRHAVRAQAAAAALRWVVETILAD